MMNTCVVPASRCISKNTKYTLFDQKKKKSRSTFSNVAKLGSKSIRNHLFIFITSMDQNIKKFALVGRLKTAVVVIDNGQ